MGFGTNGKVKTISLLKIDIRIPFLTGLSEPKYITQPEYVASGLTRAVDVTGDVKIFAGDTVGGMGIKAQRNPVINIK